MTSEVISLEGREVVPQENWLVPANTAGEQYGDLIGHPSGSPNPGYRLFLEHD